MSAAADMPEGTDVVATPIIPSEPRALIGAGSVLWRRLVDGPVDDADLSEEEQLIVREMAETGLASDDPEHPARTTSVSPPWLVSPFHELVYALVSSVATQHGIPHVFIKGPVLHAQGLREREHSGDVDIWVEPGREDDLAEAMTPWGWKLLPLPLSRAVYHSVTLKRSTWGCEVDVHYRFPGIRVDDDEAFTLLRRSATPVEYAGVASFAPERTMHAVLHALHEVRPNPGLRLKTERVDAAATALRVGGPETLSRAAGWGATPALVDAVRAAYPDTELVDAEANDPWGWANKGTWSYYIWGLSGLTVGQRVRALGYLIWPPASTIMISDSLLDEPAPTVLKARLRRYRRGVTVLFRRRRTVDTATSSGSFSNSG